MEMHAIQSKQAPMSSGCIVAKQDIARNGATSCLAVIRQDWSFICGICCPDAYQRFAMLEPIRLRILRLRLADQRTRTSQRNLRKGNKYERVLILNPPLAIRIGLPEKRQWAFP